jgi:hypothetical protein
MKLLFENWRKYLNENKLEESRVRDVGQQATEIAREVFKFWKNMFSKHSDDTVIQDVLKNKKGEIKTEWYSRATNFKIRRRDLKNDPKAQAWRQIRLHLHLQLKVARQGGALDDVGQGKIYQIKGGYASWDYMQKNSIDLVKEEGLDYLKISIDILHGATIKEIKNNYQNIYMDLLETIAHELEHREQELRDLHGAEGEGFGDEITTSRDSLVGYLMQKHEIEGYARGIYTKSIKSKIPFEYLVDQTVDMFLQLCKWSMENSPEWSRKICTKEDMAKFKGALMSYAEKQLRQYSSFSTLGRTRTRQRS